MKWPKLKVGNIIYIEWEDHCTDMPKWARRDEWHHSVCGIKSVGFVVVDGKNYLTIVQMLQDDNQVASQSLTVIKSCVTKVKILEK